MKRQKTFWVKCANRTTARRAAMTKGTPIDRHADWTRWIYLPIYIRVYLGRVQLERVSLARWKLTASTWNSSHWHDTVYRQAVCTLCGMVHWSYLHTVYRIDQQQQWSTWSLIWSLQIYQYNVSEFIPNLLWKMWCKLAGYGNSVRNVYVYRQNIIGSSLLNCLSLGTHIYSGHLLNGNYLPILMLYNCNDVDILVTGDTHINDRTTTTAGKATSAYMTKCQREPIRLYRCVHIICCHSDHFTP